MDIRKEIDTRAELIKKINTEIDQLINRKKVLLKEVSKLESIQEKANEIINPLPKSA